MTTETMTTMTNADLARAARDYDPSNSGCYNPYLNELEDRERAADAVDPYERLTSLQRDLRTADSSVAREWGQDNSDEVAEIRRQIADVEREIDERFLAQWPIEIAAARTRAWNDKIKELIKLHHNDGKKVYAAADVYAKEVGYTLADIKRAARLHGAAKQGD